MVLSFKSIERAIKQLALENTCVSTDAASLLDDFCEFFFYV